MVNVGLAVVGGFVALVGGFVGLRKARRQWGIRSEIQTAEDGSVEALRRGVVELSGTAEPAGETFTAPLTGRECVAYRYEVEEWQRKRGHSNSGRQQKWKNVKNEERAVPFYVNTGVNRVLVDAPVAEFRLEKAHGAETDDGKVRPTGRLKGLITGEDPGYDMPITDRVKAQAEAVDTERRYREYLILPDESVYVYGEAMPPEEARSGEGGLSSVAGMLGSVGVFPLSGVFRTITGVTGNKAEYRRSSRRPREKIDVQPDDVENLKESIAGMDEGDRKAELQRRRERFEQIAERVDDPESMTRAEKRQLKEEVQEVAPEVKDTLDSFQSHLGDAVDVNLGSGNADADGADPFADERLVVSRGDTIGEFVVSDHEKGGVVRSYTKSTLKWLGIGLACIAVGALVAAYGVGVPFDELRSAVTAFVPVAGLAGVAGAPRLSGRPDRGGAPGTGGPAGRSSVERGDRR